MENTGEAAGCASSLRSSTWQGFCLFRWKITSFRPDIKNETLPKALATRAATLAARSKPAFFNREGPESQHFREGGRYGMQKDAPQISPLALPKARQNPAGKG